MIGTIFIFIGNTENTEKAKKSLETSCPASVVSSKNNLDEIESVLEQEPTIMIDITNNCVETAILINKFKKSYQNLVFIAYTMGKKCSIYEKKTDQNKIKNAFDLIINIPNDLPYLMEWKEASLLKEDVEKLSTSIGQLKAGCL